MLLTHVLTDDLTAIAHKAQSLPERVQQLLTISVGGNGTAETVIGDNPTDGDDPADIEKRLDFWCQVVAKGDWERFQKRLAWDGLSLETARLLVSTSAQSSAQFQYSELPAWTQTLARVMETAQRFQAQRFQAQPVSMQQNRDRALDGDRPIPFEEVYLPCLEVARQGLQAALNAADGLLSEAVQTTLERQLLNTLGSLAAPTLMREFSQFRTTGNTLRDFLTISIQGPSHRDRYHAFLNAQLEDGLRSLLEKYSVLGRLIATTIDFWVESTAEWMTHLTTDWATLQQRFSPQQPFTQVVAITTGLSDLHNRGRSVAILTFDTGMKLVYKPKDIALEDAFGALLQWFNQQGFGLDFRSPQILNGKTHGWAEFIEALPCQTEAEVYRFYQRSGMLMGLIHVLEGTDCHYENLIASGEYPVLVDMETLFHPHMTLSTHVETDAIAQLAQKLDRSVLRTALLPLKELTISNDLLSIDLSGLGQVEEQMAPTLIWKYINTDGMTVDTESMPVTIEANLPTLNGVMASPEPFIDAIVDGFEQMYRWLMQHRTALLATDGPLQAFAHQDCRLLFRNTRTYGAILAQSYDPELMKAGMARSIGLDVLSRAFLVNADKPPFWGLLAAEKQAMEQLDIPLLTANTSSAHLDLEGIPTATVTADRTTEQITVNRIVNLFEMPSFERVLANIETLNEADLSFQCQVIQFALGARFLQEPQPTDRESNPADPMAVGVSVSTLPIGRPTVSGSADVLSPESLSPDDLRQQAIAIAQTLQHQAIGTVEEGLGWLTMGYQHRHQSFHIQSMGLTLYDGCCGIAVFLGALARVTGDSQWRDWSLAALYPWRRVLATLDVTTRPKLMKQVGIGGGDGMGSILYALTRLSRWLDEPTLRDEAFQAASLITPALIAADRTFDVVGGVAGTILGLLSLLEGATAEQQTMVLTQAIACGQQLLDHRTGGDNEPRAWVTGRYPHPLTGFSQGAAGIAYALLRLFEVTQEPRWLDAAIEAIAYEQTQFSPEAQNWLDRRSSVPIPQGSPQPVFQTSWAHGAPGITLGRLGGLSSLDTAAIRAQIAIGLQTTQTALIWGSDSLCWGNLGRIETLVVAAQRLQRPDLLEDARRATATVLAKARCCEDTADRVSSPNARVPQDGFNLFNKGSDGVMNPGFFQGLSGIGYELLRIADPSQLPSVLLWE